MEIVRSLDVWFAEHLRDIRCSEDVRAYVVGVLAGDFTDMSDQSVILAFDVARTTGEFERYQHIGDWSLWSAALAPHPDRAQRELLELFGRLSYHACHRLLRGEWQLYAELADELPVIVYDVRCNVDRLRRRIGP